MADYKNYLAANILTEDKVVTYRILSRALKVHVNAAKEMLYKFHRQQNAKKVGSVYATYLISGTKSDVPAVANGAKDGEDEMMQSSPFQSSSMPIPSPPPTGETSTLNITIVKEEDLEEIKSTYDRISCIHIYSLGPGPLQDLQLLSDCNRELQVITATENPLENLPTYGTISNPLVKRRPTHRPPPPIAAPVKPAVAPAAKPKVESSKEKEKKVESKQSSAVAKDFFAKGKAGNAPNSSKESTPVPPANLKRENSSIFKSFAKAKPKLDRQATDSSAVEEDSPMKNVSDDDDDDEGYIPPMPEKKANSNAEEEGQSSRKSRKDKEAALRKMMEEDDDDDEEQAVPEPEPEAEEETVLEKQPEIKEEEPNIEVSGGRRRGKRKVMKKKTVQDEEGYLVTREEAVWESFSEDEPAPKVQRQAPTNIAAKGKKAAPKAGQGNIMSFFGKK